MPLYALVVRESFGEKVMGSAYGAVFLISTLGMGLGSFAAGPSTTGSARTRGSSCSFAIGMALVLAFTFRRPTRMGARNGPHYPRRSSRPAKPWRASTPSSSRPGEAVARLDPDARRPGEAVRASTPTLVAPGEAVARLDPQRSSRPGEAVARAICRQSTSPSRITRAAGLHLTRSPSGGITSSLFRHVSRRFSPAHPRKPARRLRRLKESRRILEWT